MISRGEVEAEDLAQDALERAIRRLASFDPARGTVEGWLWRIVLNAAADAGRTARRRHLLLEKLQRFRPTEEMEELTVPDSVMDTELLDAVRRLGYRDRMIIALRFGGGLSHTEVGDALGIAPGAASVACRRALARLRRDLGKEKRT
jgi:RNA polymerase sigma-70 factor (ECF subfamily)